MKAVELIVIFALSWVLLPLSAVATSPDKPQPLETATAHTDLTPSVIELVEQLNYGDAMPQLMAVSTTGHSSGPQQSIPDLPKTCEGYNPPSGCTVEFNNGIWCTERCGLILQVCACVQ